MARKLHLAVMNDGQLEQHRTWLLAEHAACLAERELRGRLAELGLHAQARLAHMNRDGSWTVVPDELEDGRLFTDQERAGA